MQIHTAIPLQFAVAQGILFVGIFYVVIPISSKKVAMPPGSLSGVLARKSHRSRLPESMLTARALGLSFITAHGNANCGLKLYILGNWGVQANVKSVLQ